MSYHPPCAPSPADARLELRTHAGIASIPAPAWDALDPSAHPFTRHAFLLAMEASDSVRVDAGWSPCHVALWQGASLVAASPAYLKSNSHGEFVFDQSWARASLRAGLAYYPKLLLAVPYSPVSGPRLLALDDSTRATLARSLIAAAEPLDVSGVHVNFAQAADTRALDEAGFIARHDVQFHWRNDGQWRDWSDFSAALSTKRRKNIRQERGRLLRAGWRFERLEGDAIDAGVLDAAFALYQRTFASKYNHAALTRQFFERLHAAMPGALMIVRASHADGFTAMAISVQSATTLYGRYWGSDADEVPGLHFETCYHQGIEHCLSTGRSVFEPGAQGEHKLARGFLPVVTESRHWLREPRLHQAVRQAMQSERTHVARYREELLAHSPFAMRTQ